MRRIRVIGILFAASTVACEPAANTVWWEGEFIRYTMSDDLATCGGTYELVDSFVPFIAGELEIEAPRNIEYSWLKIDEYEMTECPKDTEGCAKKQRAYAQDPVLLH